MSPEEVRQQIQTAIEAVRKFGDENNIPENLRLAVESTGEAFLNTYDFSYEWVAKGLGARTEA